MMKLELMEVWNWWKYGIDGSMELMEVWNWRKYGIASGVDCFDMDELAGQIDFL
jgi:hypothetical protein